MEEPRRGQRFLDALYTGFPRASPDVRRTTYRERVRRSELLAAGSFVALWRRPTGRGVIKVQIRPGTATVIDGEVRFVDSSRVWQFRCVPSAVTNEGGGHPWYGETTRLALTCDDTDVVIDVPEAQIAEITELINGIVTPD